MQALRGASLLQSSAGLGAQRNNGHPAVRGPITTMRHATVNMRGRLAVSAASKGKGKTSTKSNQGQEEQNGLQTQATAALAEIVASPLFYLVAGNSARWCGYISLAGSNWAANHCSICCDLLWTRFSA